MYGDQPLLPLLNDVLDTVDIPVLAAGGLATARDVAAMLVAGAAGARLGTRFVATEESGAHPAYKQAIVDAAADETVLVTDFSVLWPNGPEPHRVLKRALDAARALDADIVGEAGGTPVPIFAVIPPVAGYTGNIEAFAMYAGTSVGSIHSIEPAAAVVQEIAEGTARLLTAGAQLA
jgi:NAD(P)H-dependent flavin oxidoreductase YrpB (nitropropane dioxygenase family)